jgi:chitin disaccharide deacetylase
MSRVVILNADDFGYDPAVTRGIVKAMREGVVSSTTMMVNTPHSADAAHDCAGLSIGLHFNVMRFHSISRKHFEFQESEISKHSVRFLSEELEAQFDELRSLIGRDPTHIDVHKHAHQHENVLEALVNCATRAHLKVRSIDDRMRARFKNSQLRTNDAFLGDAGTNAFWTLSEFENQLKKIPPNGVTELMCHPGYAPSHVASGYSAQREVEMATLSSTQAKELMSLLGVVFSSWLAV